jgi:hypothetical protein
MKKKYLSMVALAVFMTAVINLQAQDSPNGIEPGSGTPILDQQSWNLMGNTLSNTSGNKLGSVNAYPIRICTTNTDRIYIDAGGSIGINTTSPLQMLHVVEGNILISASSERAPGSANGSILFGDEPTSTNPYGKWGIEYVGNEDEGYGLNFWKPYNTGGGFMNNVLFLADNGNVGVGTNEPPAKFSVNGKVLAKEVHVCTSPDCWPDYVFGENYKLMNLKELDAYVKANKHLPGVPSASEVEEQGDVDLGQMNAILLEKVEELTRYVIDLQKQIDEMKKIDIRKE